MRSKKWLDKTVARKTWDSPRVVALKLNSQVKVKSFRQLITALTRPKTKRSNNNPNKQNQTWLV